MKKVSNMKIGDFNAICTYNFELNKKADFLVTSYWWGKGNVNRNSRENKTYDELADRFINDCIKSKCNFFVAEIPEFAVPGGYQKAINYKPEFIINILTKIMPKNINKAVYIDTDMSVHKFPSLFNMKGYDFMGYNWNWEPRTLYNEFPMDCYDPYTLHTSGGLLMFADTEPSLQLLDAWNEMVKKNPGKAEDRMISIPFNNDDMITKLRCFWLPDEYFWVPFFYELDAEFIVQKKYQKDFKKRGITFTKEESEEINMGEFYGIKKRDIIVSHPEKLTDEEMAAKQGADLNRVPMEWFKSQGRKKRCLTDLDKLVINPNLFLQTAADFKAMDSVYNWLKESHFAKLEDKPLKLDEKKLSIYTKDLTHDSDHLFVTVMEKGLPDYVLDKWLEIVGENDYIILDKYTDLPSTIYSVMKKYKKDILWLDIHSTPTKAFDGFDDLFRNSDFACLNANSYPYYTNNMGDRCKDVRFLNCPTTDLLYFKNNIFGINILRVWKHSTREKVSDAQKLSKGFNKYGVLLNTRVKWLHPGWMYNKAFITSKRGIEVHIETTHNYIKVNKKVGLDDYLIQCGEKRAISTNETPYLTHYKGSKIKGGRKSPRPKTYKK